MSEEAEKVAFSFEDEAGQTVITDSLDQIPEQYRKLAKKISGAEAKKVVGELEKKLELAKKKGLSGAKEAQREVGDILPFVKDVDLPSFALGFAGALAMVLVFAILRRTGRLVLKLALVLVIAALVAGAYFAWLRRAAGLGDTHLSSPTAVIDDAREAAKAMEKRLKDQKRMLEKIEKTSR